MKKQNKTHSWSLLYTSSLIAGLMLTACGSGNNSGTQIPSSAMTGENAPESSPVGTASTSTGTPAPTSTSTGTSTGTAATPSSTPTVVAGGTPTPITTPTPGMFSSCVNSDPNHICIGLKMVSYQNSAGVPDLTAPQAETLTQGMNAIWSTCNIAFQVETFQIVDPTTLGLAYNSDWQNDGDTIRAKFADQNTFLVVLLGTLTGSTIGVTEMPGAGVYGTLIENAYAKNPLTVGHELGHYQGLFHISDATNLMNPYIGSNTSALTTSQCTTARSTDLSNWKAMLRK